MWHYVVRRVLMLDEPPPSATAIGIGISIMSVISWVWGIVPVIWFVAGAVSFADMIVGSVKARRESKFSSERLGVGITNRLLTFCLAGLIAFTQIEMGNHFGADFRRIPTPWGDLPFALHDGFLLFIIYKSWNSILENALLMGIDVPPFLVRGFRVAAERLEGIGDSIGDIVEGRPKEGQQKEPRA